MRSFLLILFTLSFSMGLSQTRGLNSPPPKEEGMTAEEAELIIPVISQFSPNTQFAMAFVNEGEVKYLGLILQDGKVISIDNRDSVFEIGSISKVFTTHLLANLVESGKVEMDQPISSHLNFSLKGEPSITFHQLATHQSGLPYFPSNVGGLFNQKNPFKGYTTEKFEQYLSQKVKLDFQPGENYRYSNVGLGLLGYLVESILEQSYETLLKEQIFNPLGMSRSTTQVSEVDAYLVRGRDRKGAPTPNWNLGALVGAGGILSTPSDLASYAAYSFTLLGSEEGFLGQKPREIDTQLDMAMGWHIIKESRKAPFLWHNGGTGGYKASMAIDPVQQDAVIILSNVGTDTPGKRSIDKLCFEMMESLE